MLLFVLINYNSLYINLQNYYFYVCIVQRCNGIAAWKYFPWYNWYDHYENKELKRVAYNKTRNDTILRVAFHSTLAQFLHAGCGVWYIKFSGNECTQPAPIRTTVYADHSNGASGWTTIPTELSGFCDATSASSIKTGPVVISVHVRKCSSAGANVYTGRLGSGSAVTSFITVEEYCR